MQDHRLDPAAGGARDDYLADRAATCATATLARRLAAISTAHPLAGNRLNTRHSAIRTVMQEIRRTSRHRRRTRRPRFAPVSSEPCWTPCGTTSLIDRRDRALLLLGLISALRRAELAMLTVADLDYVAEGVTLSIACSKTDQEAAYITDGAVFRHRSHGRIAADLPDRAIALIVNR